MITSAGNARVRAAIQLKQKAKARREMGAFLTEGVKMFLEAPEEQIREIYVSESFSCQDQELKRAVTEKMERLPYEMVSEPVFQKMSDTCTPQGILCVMEAQHYVPADLLKKEAPLLLLLENIQDPGNLGTMMRAGEGAGIDGLVLSRDTADIYNPKAVRATMGSIYRVPFLYAQDFGAMMARLKEAGICIYAAHLQGETDYDRCDFHGGSAFLIGNEAKGLTGGTAARADRYMKIPMAGEVESLNAGIAAAILMYEAARQRRRQR